MGIRPDQRRARLSQRLLYCRRNGGLRPGLWFSQQDPWGVTGGRLLGQRRSSHVEKTLEKARRAEFFLEAAGNDTIYGDAGGDYLNVQDSSGDDHVYYGSGDSVYYDNGDSLHWV